MDRKSDDEDVYDTNHGNQDESVKKLESSKEGAKKSKKPFSKNQDLSRSKD